MCHIPPRGRHAHLPQTGLPALRAVPSSWSTVVCRRHMWLCPRCVLSCDLPGMALSPPLWEIPSATNLSHTFPLKTADQDYPTLFSSFVSSKFPPHLILTTPPPPPPSGLRSYSLSIPEALPCPIIFPCDPELLGFCGPLLHLPLRDIIPHRGRTDTLGAG